MERINTIDKYYAFGLSEQVKTICRNGIIHKGTSFHKLATQDLKLKGSYNTHLKGWRLLQRIGAFKKSGKHLQLINRNEIAEKLGIDHTFQEGFWLNRKLRKKRILKFTPTQLTNYFIGLSIMQDLIKQKFYADKKATLRRMAQVVLFDDITNESIKNKRAIKRASLEEYKASSKAIFKLAKKHNLKTVELACSMVKSPKLLDNSRIKTGSYHLARKFGVSQTKINSLLNRYHNNGLLKRQIISERVDLPCCKHSYNYLKEKYPNKGIIPLKSKQGYNIILGSRVKVCLF